MRGPARLPLLLALALLQGCSAARRAWDRVKPAPQALVLDQPAYAGVTHVVVLSGGTKYAAPQKLLLGELEGALKEQGCWKLMGHEEFGRKVEHQAPPPPYSAEHAPLGLNSAVLERLPRRDERLAVLAVWVTDWDGERYRELDVVGDAGELLFDAALGAIFGGKPADDTYTYGRGVVAQLIDSRGGKVLWRAKRKWRKTEKLTSNRLVPWAPEPVREAEKRRERDEFRALLTEGLTLPRGSCAGTGAASTARAR